MSTRYFNLKENAWQGTSACDIMGHWRQVRWHHRVFLVLGSFWEVTMSMSQRRRRLSVQSVASCIHLLLVGVVCASSSNDASFPATFVTKTSPIPMTTTQRRIIPAPTRGPLALPPSHWCYTQPPAREKSETMRTNNSPVQDLTESMKDTNNKDKSTPSEQSSSTSQSNHHSVSPLRWQHQRRHSPLWIIPFVASSVSFVSFKRTSRIFHGLVQWMSGNTWIPKSFKELNLQANVVTQVINGPVITSISVLFASLVSMTVSSLYQRQADIQLCLTNEIQALQICKACYCHNRHHNHNNNKTSTSIWHKHKSIYNNALNTL